jgi:hypothetical protein
MTAPSKCDSPKGGREERERGRFISTRSVRLLLVVSSRDNGATLGDMYIRSAWALTPVNCPHSGMKIKIYPINLSLCVLTLRGCEGIRGTETSVLTGTNWPWSIMPKPVVSHGLFSTTFPCYWAQPDICCLITDSFSSEIHSRLFRNWYLKPIHCSPRLEPGI